MVSDFSGERWHPNKYSKGLKPMLIYLDNNFTFFIFNPSLFIVFATALEVPLTFHLNLKVKYKLGLA